MCLILSIQCFQSYALPMPAITWGWGEKIWFYTDVEYNEASRILLRTAYALDAESGIFEPKVQRTYRHTEDPVYTEEILSSWNRNKEEWSVIQKYEYTYNERGDLVQYEEADRSPDAWIPSRRSVNDFDENGNQILKARYSRDWDNSFWIAETFEEYAYNEENQQTSHTSYTWDASLKDVVPGQKTEWVYDLEGLNTLILSYDWNVALNEWRQPGRTENSFNDSHLLTHSKKILWNGQAYENFSWSSIVYTPEGIPYLIIDSLYNSRGSLDPYRKLESILEEGHVINTTEYNWAEDAWIPHKKNDFAFDAQWRQLSDSTFLWLDIEGIWSPLSYVQSDYDESGNQIREIKTEKNFGFDGGLEFNSKRILNFDQYGNQILYEYYRWDGDKEDWKGMSKYEQTHDENARMLSYASYTWDDNIRAWTGIRKDYFTYDAEGRLVLEQGVKWEELTATGMLMEQRAGMDMHMYPNPASLSLSVEFDPPFMAPPARIIIFSMQGIKQAEYVSEPAGTQIDISMLEPGSYLLLLKSGSGIASRIFLKN